MYFIDDGRAISLLKTSSNHCSIYKLIFIIFSVTQPWWVTNVFNLICSFNKVDQATPLRVIMISFFHEICQLVCYCIIIHLFDCFLKNSLIIMKRFTKKSIKFKRIWWKPLLYYQFVMHNKKNMRKGFWDLSSDKHCSQSGDWIRVSSES